MDKQGQPNIQPAFKQRTRSRGNKKTHFSFVNVLTGSDLSTRRLALMKSKGKKDGPIVWLTGAIHGDEVGGIVIIQEIFKELRKHPLLRGTLYALPLMNPIGFESSVRGLPLSEEDLNRSFPGDPQGSLAERIAYQIFTTITKTKPTLVLDLHNDWSSSIPYTLIDPYPGNPHREAYEQVKQFCFLAGFPVIDEQEPGNQQTDLQRSLSGSMLKNNIPSFTLEIGGAYIVNEHHVRSGTIALWNILTELGMVTPRDDLKNSTPDAHKKILRYSHQPRANASGIIRFLVKPGTYVEKDQPLARIYNVFGKLQSTLTATSDGLMLGHADSAVAFPGAEVMAFGV